MEDRLIYVAVALLVLSLISERIANFLKLRLPQPGKYSKLQQSKIRSVIGNLRKRETDPGKEKKREGAVLVLNILCGFGIAASFKVDLFEVFQKVTSEDTVDEIIGWNGKITFDSFLGHLPGILLAGIFMSFGSKFWHDMLDLLLEVKNYRRALADKTTYELPSATDVETYAQLDTAEINRLAQEANKEFFEDDNIIATEIRFFSDQFKLLVRVAKMEVFKARNISKIKYKVSTGTEITIQVEPVTSLPILPHFIYSSDLIINKTQKTKIKSKQEAGSIGCLVRKEGSDKPYLLTCYHVVKSLTHRWDKFVPSADSIDEVYAFDDQELLGRITEAIRDSYFDYAIVQLQDNVLFDRYIPNIGRLEQIRSITIDDIQNQTLVEMSGGASGHSIGKIVGYCSDVKIDYPDGRHALHNLIAIKGFESKQFSRGRDSGAIVLQNKVGIGMLVAGNTDISYAIPLTELFKNFKLDLL